jgi:predicted nucleotidyltransferase
MMEHLVRCMPLDKQHMLDVIVSTLKEHGAVEVLLFGSFARGSEKKESDVDIIVEFKETKSLIEHMQIEMELQDKIGRKLDMFTKKSIDPHLKEHIMSQAVVIG